MADFEGKVRGLGKRFQDAGQQYIKQQVDDPVQQLREEMARRQAEKAKAEVMAGAPPPQMNGQRMPGYQPRPGDKVIPHVLPDDPNAPESQKQARMAAMIAATENLSRIKEKEAAQRGQYEAEDAERAQAERDFDPSQYKKVERPGQDGQPITPPRFGGLAAQMQQVQQQAAAQVPESSGMIELSEDPEEQQRQIAEAHARMGR